MSNPLNRDDIREIVRVAVERQMNAENNLITDESRKDVIIEAEVRNIAVGGSLLIREDAILTPSAEDMLRYRNITLRRRSRNQQISRHLIIALGADHGGFAIKERMKQFLTDLGHQHRDFGTSSEEAVDYPDFAHAVARAVADGICDFGIILDGAGIGSCMTANKVPGIRAAMCYDEATARNSREHNHANVLTLGAKILSLEQIQKIVQTWLQTEEGEARHGKRVAKIVAIEKQYAR